MIMCNVKGLVCSDKLTQNYHLTLHFSTELFSCFQLIVLVFPARIFTVLLQAAVFSGNALNNLLCSSCPAPKDGQKKLVTSWWT